VVAIPRWRIFDGNLNAVRIPITYSIYAGSLLFEVIADGQKTSWRNAKEKKEHDEQFISSGLWSISRHPK